MAGFWENYGKENARFVEEPRNTLAITRYIKKNENYFLRKEREMLRRENEKS